MSEQHIIDAESLTLDEWVELLRMPPDGAIFVRNRFPSDAHREQWLSSAHTRSEAESRMLLRYFLISTGSTPSDMVHGRLVVNGLREGESLDELSEHDLHLLRHALTNGEYPVWEGLGWVIDLVEMKPRQALDVLDAYLWVHCQSMSDNYLFGLSDAQAVIRKRYIESAHTRDLALRAIESLSWREAEFMCGVIYHALGYDVVVTPSSDDDGVDVLASRAARGEQSHLVVQVKKWRDSNPVGKAEIRELLGAMELRRATAGVLVSTGRFESGALKLAEEHPRLSTIGLKQFVEMANSGLGPSWHLRVDHLLQQAKSLAGEGNR